MQESDKELLELAAKACGEITPSWYGHMSYLEGVLSRWNPLQDDGDALRLAVKLDFDLWNSDNYTAIGAGIVPDDNMFDAKLHSEWKLEDSYAATRRAIVRAAAEIGRNMK